MKTITINIFKWALCVCVYQIEENKDCMQLDDRKYVPNWKEAQRVNDSEKCLKQRQAIQWKHR